MTVGIVQWCDKFNLVTRMLGYIASKGGIELITKPLGEALKISNATFMKNLVGDYRFFMNGVECNTPEMLRKLYFGGALGTKGSWSEEQKKIAKTWCVGMVNIWDDTRARELQLEYTAKRVDTFTLADANKLLMNPNKSWDGFIGATKAAYISYAANNPVTANKLLKQAYAEDLLDVVVGTEEWAIKIIKRLALGSNIKIWPERYDRLRPAIEKLFGVVLPKDHIALENYVFANKVDVIIDTIPSPPKFSSIEELSPEFLEDQEIQTAEDANSPVRIVDSAEMQTNPTELVYFKRNQAKQNQTFISFIKFVFALIAAFFGKKR
jgi:hypothetical protein